MVLVSELAEEIQHKIYDYLEELGIGDGTATFINDYNDYRANKKYADTLSYVSDFFAKE